MILLKHEINYTPDSASVFALIADWPWAIFLDSGQPKSQYGHYDILVADPFITLTTNENYTEIHDAHGIRTSTVDPFWLLKEVLAPYAVEEGELPFCGGAIGYFGYDLARQLEHLPAMAADAEHMPQMMIGVYDWAVLVDHRAKRAWLVSQGKD